METVGCQSCSSSPAWWSHWEAVRHRPRRGEGTAAASPVVATALGDRREAESSGVVASVGDELRAGTIATAAAGHSSCSHTSMTPTTRTTRTATRIHLTTLLNTATGTVRRTWGCSEKYLWLAI